MPDILVVGVVALVAGLVGFGIALLVRRSFALGSETTARANADRLLAEARAKQKEIILEAKDEAIKTAKTAETENRDRRAELQRYEARLDKKDEQLDQKIAQLQKIDINVLNHNNVIGAGLLGPDVREAAAFWAENHGGF